MLLALMNSWTHLPMLAFPWDHLSTFALTVVGMLLILIVLLQRGRGGGLAGAFGGMGGQSAFGTKAGDVFTRITVVLAFIWVMLAGVSGWALRAQQTRFPGGTEAVSPAPTLAPTDAAEEEPAENGLGLPERLPPAGEIPPDAGRAVDPQAPAGEPDPAADAPADN